MLIARPMPALAAQGLVAAIYAGQGAMSAWQEAGTRLPVCLTLIDVDWRIRAFAFAALTSESGKDYR